MKDIQIVLRMLFGFLIIKALTFLILVLSSGNIWWLSAWTILGFDVLYIFFMGTIARIFFPESLQARVKTKFVYSWDRFAILLYSIGFYGQYIIGGLDQRINGPHFYAFPFFVGVGLYALGMAITFWVLAVNPFATGSARIQEDRNQKIITTGPYRFLRHPMYFATVLFCTATPLLLSSYWAYAGSPIVIFAFLFRCSKEDKMLMNELDGYPGYAKKVRYRMIPLIW